MFVKFLKGLVWPLLFLFARAKAILLLSRELARAGRRELAHATIEGGLEAAIKAEPIGRRAPARVIEKRRRIAILAQIAAIAVVCFTVFWVIAGDAGAIEIANFVVFATGLTALAFLASFAVSIARGGKLSFWRFLTDPAGLLAEPWMPTDAKRG
jgi:hypothetical protein